MEKQVKKAEKPKTERKRSRGNRKTIEEQVECRTSAERIINRQLHHEIELRKRLEEELKISEVRFRRLFETSQDGILMLDFYSGQIVEVNPFLMDLLGYTRKDFLGKKLWEIGTFKNIGTAKNVFMKLQDEGYARYEDLPLETKDGRIIEVEFISHVYAVNHKKIFQCNIRDASERMRLERIKEGIARKVYHEIRNPLTIMKAGLALVLRKAAGDLNEKQEKLLAIINNAMEKLILISTELLDIDKLEAGKIELKRERMSLRSVVEEVAVFFELKIKEKGLEFRLKFPDKEIDVYADKDKIFQVFSNLIGNAIKFTEKGYIEVSVGETGGHVQISVSDTGRGIAKPDLSKVFGEFEQFGEILKSIDKGMGLGLVITKGIIELSKGKIWVESEIGKGTKFSFTLPKVIPAHLK